VAAPIIRSATLDRAEIEPGGTAVLTVDAIDPDAREIVLSATATDSGSHTSAVTETRLIVGDPITYDVTSNDAGVTVTPVPGRPGQFTISVE
jgi:hypothetical protein